MLNHRLTAFVRILIGTALTWAQLQAGVAAPLHRFDGLSETKLKNGITGSRALVKTSVRLFH